MKQIDISGRKFGLWTAVKYVGNRKWLCRCACGLEKSVNVSNLRGGLSTGCRHCKNGAINKLPVGIAAFNNLLGNYKKNAKVRGISWNLTAQDAGDLFVQPCFYCGDPPSSVFPNQNSILQKQLNGTFIYSGIDRVDSTKGYEKSNCVGCCKKCNYMKRSYSVGEFFSHIEKIYLRQLEAL